jgi:uncharacterized protein (UPF0276 family)
MPARFPVPGKGLGLRRPLLGALEAAWPAALDFMELAPENWFDIGGRSRRRLRALAERIPLIAHGLGLNLGGPAPLDEAWLRSLKAFLEEYGVRCFSEHLSYCADDGQLYELLPVPFTADAVRHVAARIRTVQDLLERRIALENISYYCAPGAEMSELEFLNAVLAEADCDLLIDVNNIYVNSVNHGYDALEFLAGLPAERIAYAHIAGHCRKAPDLLIDTHGAPIVDPVWALLDAAYARCGVFPTLLERDFNLPPLAELLDEVARIGNAQAAAAPRLEQRRA